MTSGQPVPPDCGWEEGTSSHCRRVAAWSSELASALGLPESERKLVEQAALSHHLPEVLLNDNGRRRLLADLRVEEGGNQPPIPEEVRELLQAFRGGSATPAARLVKLATLLEISDDFDQSFEAEPLLEAERAAGHSTDSSVETSVESMMSYLQVTSRAD